MSEDKAEFIDLSEREPTQIDLNELKKDWISAEREINGKTIAQKLKKFKDFILKAR